MISSTVFYKREAKTGTTRLSLVALMDIFTILVFFLLLNSGESQEIENAKFISLPDSSKGISPHKELMILVGEEEIWLDKEVVAVVNEVLKGPEDIIEPLSLALQDHVGRIDKLSGFQKEKGLSVIIMGDKDVPYVLLKSVMATCRFNNFLNISLAVNRIADSNKPLSAAGATEVVPRSGG